MPFIDLSLHKRRTYKWVYLRSVEFRPESTRDKTKREQTKLTHQTCQQTFFTTDARALRQIAMEQFAHIRIL